MVNNKNLANGAHANSATLEVVYRDIPVGFRSKLILWFMRIFMKRLLGMMARAKPERIAKLQLRVASLKCPDSAGLSIDYDIVGRVPGHIIGNLDNTDRPLVLWLHGGAFVFPAAPTAHLGMVAQLCKQLDADAYLPDYRLTPLNPFPAGLDDCENAYRALLEFGYSPLNIILGGDSAGGNLVFGLLQRIRKAGLPMPACAVPVSPVTEMGRVHGPPSRHRVQKSDPLLPVAALSTMCADYIGDRDSADPEISPLYMDCEGLPPLFFLASSNEVLMDDTVMLARRTHAAGVPTTCHIWPLLPHAFPLFAATFHEARPAIADIADFARRHLN